MLKIKVIYEFAISDNKVHKAFSCHDEGLKKPHLKLHDAKPHLLWWCQVRNSPVML